MLTSRYTLYCGKPAHVKKFAGEIGRKAKTDKLDAQFIAHYGEEIKPTLSTLKSENMQLISNLSSRRRQLVNMQTMEKNRLKIMPKEITSIIKPILTVVKNQIKVDKKLSNLIEKFDEYKTKNTIIQSMPALTLWWLLTYSAICPNSVI